MITTIQKYTTSSLNNNEYLVRVKSDKDSPFDRYYEGFTTDNQRAKKLDGLYNYVSVTEKI